MDQTALGHYRIDIPCTHVPRWRVAELTVEAKGVIRLTRKSRRLLGIRPGDTVRLVPIGRGRVILIGSDQPPGLAELR